MWFLLLNIVDSIQVLLLFVMWILTHHIFLCVRILGSCRYVKLTVFIAFRRKLNASCYKE